MTKVFEFQKCLMRLGSFRYYQWLVICCCCSVLFLHAESQEFESATIRNERIHPFGSRVNNNPAKNNSRRSHSNWNVINHWKNHIKAVLNIDKDNDSIDNYIFETFNIFNPDPTYVFLLPDDFNRTIVLRRSNFTEITFPNMTALQTIQKILRSSKFKPLLETDRRRPKDLLNEDRHFFAKYQQFILDESDLYEAESLKVVEENIRTERNFFHFMDKLNGDDSDAVVIEADKPGIRSTKRRRKKPHPMDYQTLIKNLHANENIGNYELTVNAEQEQQSRIVWPHKNKVTWEDFGLHGWAGSINMQHDNPEENGTPLQLPTESPKQSDIFPNKFLPILPNYDPLHLLSTTTPVSTTKVLDSHKDKDRPQMIHQVTFVQHNGQYNGPKRKRPKPPEILFPIEDHTTKKPVQLFFPATGPAYLPPLRGHRRPNSYKDDFDDDSWEIQFNITDELRELLRLEKNKLEAISLALNSKIKWPVTSSRLKHHDDFVFVARANNPFGHSTKWKLGNSNSNGSTHSNHVSIDYELEEEGRKKRDVIDLYSMVKCATGCDPLIYKGYGCYCGFLGRGKALDEIDRCCKMHDYCYHAANCLKFLEYFVPYLWKCYHGRPLCAIDNGEWGGPGSCAVALCECDRALSNCLRRF